MRRQLELPPLPAFPNDPSRLVEGPVAFLHSGGGKGKAYLALGAYEELRVEHSGKAFEALEAFSERSGDWIFGILSYELKDELESLRSSERERIGFPLLYFFRPQVLFELEEAKTRALYLPDCRSEKEVRQLHRNLSEGEAGASNSKVELKERVTREAYLEAIDSVQAHIQQGDIYEMNHCQEFFAEKADIDPYSSFTQLQSLARAPMAAYFKLDQAHLLCASPERFLRIDGDQALAQPIKGTAPRGKDEAEDLRSAERLRNDPKERAENIMIVDLVRNDLSRTAAKGSVEVEELCGIHAFPTVHQMISSIRSRIDPECSAVDVIRNAFPMGSMTGAPKVRAMELIEAYEGMRRGLYSGSVGYMDPEGNWDLNVVIRSLLYNERSRYLSAKVGGAITARSVPQKEYEECLLKAEALKRAIA